MYIALFKYMVVFQCIVAEANLAAFVVDGSSLSIWQSGAMDLSTMSLALAACWAPPLEHMSHHSPLPAVCTFSSLALMTTMVACLFVNHTLALTLLITRPWFTGGTGTSHVNPVTTVAWLMAWAELFAPLVGITINTNKFCQPVLRSRWFLLACLAWCCLPIIALLSATSDRVCSALKFVQYGMAFQITAHRSSVLWLLPIHCCGEHYAACLEQARTASSSACVTMIPPQHLQNKKLHTIKMSVNSCCIAQKKKVPTPVGMFGRV